MKRAWQAMLIVAFLGTAALAQDKPAVEPQPQENRPVSYFKIEYLLRELQDGRVINSRTYVMTVENGDRGEAKVGAKVPIATSSSPQPPVASQWQYIDVGVNIGCRVIDRGGYASLRTTLEISNFALPERATEMNSRAVIRQMRTEMAAVVPLGKQTVIGVVDDASSTKRYEIAVTATKMK